MLSTVLIATASLAGSLQVVSAHRGCGGHEGLHSRNELIQGPPSSAKYGKRQEAPSVATADCNAYYYPPASNSLSSYPGNWDTATILPGDNAAQALFQNISSMLASQFPDDQPHGTPTGNFTGVTNNPANCWWSWDGCTTPYPSTGLPNDITTVPEPGCWGLTVDDGPNCNNADLYTYFNQHNLRATLFYIGSNVQNWPLQGIRGVQDSHQICVHTWSHQYMTALSNEEVFAELYYTREIITNLLNVTAKCWRPPYGDVDNRVRAIAKALDLQTIVWEEDTNDWKEGAGATPAQIDANYNAIIEKSKNGTYGLGPSPLVLTHELTNFTMQELMMELPTIQSTFAHVVNVAIGYNDTTPYNQTDIVFPTFEQYIAGQDNVTTTSISPSATASSGSSASGAATTSGTSGSSGNANSNSNSNSGGNSNAASASSSAKSAALRGMGSPLGMMAFSVVCGGAAMGALWALI